MTNQPDIRTRKVDNPYLTEEMALAGVGVRRIDAQVNYKTLYGGFCRFGGSMSQNEAVARFKALAERCEVGGARAIDLTREAVDGGGPDPEFVQMSGADAREEMKRLRKFLGEVDYDRAWHVVVDEWSPKTYAMFRVNGRNVSQVGIDKYKAEMRFIADKMALFMKLATGSHRGIF
jgi:hypothetical protein